MKFKYLSMALAAVALASCSSDDLQLADGTTVTLADDGSQVFATIVEPEDFGGTRAGFATQINYNEDGTQKSISQTAMFQTGDKFKMYCSHSWKPQIYAFKQDAEIDGVNGTLFEYAGEEKYQADGELSTREYGVFPAENFSFKDENRSKLYYKILKTNEYQSSSDGYYASQSTSLKTSSGTDLSGRKVYSALVPMFGFNKDNKVAFNYMTSLIRVQLQGVSGDATHTLTLSQTGVAAGKTNKFQLSGEFESTVFDATEGSSAKLPVFNTVETTTADDQEVTIRFSTDGSESDYIIYIPVPTGTYDLTKLKLTYDGARDLAMTLASGDYKGGIIPAGGGAVASPTDWAAAKATAFTTASTAFELGTGTKLLAYNSEPEVGIATNLMKLNSLLNKYADFGREAVVDIDITGFQKIAKQTDGTVVDANKKLYIPELKNDVTFNLTGANITSDETNAADQILYIVDKGTAGTGKLTINFSAKDNAADRTCVKVVSTSAQNIELKTTDGAAKTAKIAGASFDNAAAKVTLNATFSAPATITKAAEITIAKDLGEDINAGTANLIVKDAISATKTITMAGGNLTIDAEAADVIPAVVLTKAAATKLDGADVLIKSGVVTSLQLADASLNINMTGGEIGTIAKAGAALEDNRAIAVSTSGAAVIGTVENFTAPAKVYNYTFTSTWNDNTTAATTPQAKIYTAAQLKAATGATPTAYTLETDIDFSLTTTTFTSIALNDAVTSFNGQNHTITGLPAALFASIGNASAALTISNLTLKNAVITPTKVTTGFGVLAKSIPATNDKAVNLTNVVVSNATLGLATGVAGSKSCNYGLLIGMANGTGNLTITDCGVSGSVKGYYNLGGYIGNLAGGATVKFIKTTENIDKNMSSVSFEKTYTTSEEEDDNAGTVGNFIGTISVATATVEIGDGAVATEFADFFSSDQVTAANIANAPKSGTKTYVGMSKHEVGRSNAGAIAAATRFVPYGAVISLTADETAAGVTLTQKYINIYE